MATKTKNKNKGAAYVAVKGFDTPTARFEVGDQIAPDVLTGAQIEALLEMEAIAKEGEEPETAEGE